MNWLAELAKIWHWLVAGLTVTLAVWASGHALLHKRDSRAATAGDALPLGRGARPQLGRTVMPPSTAITWPVT